MRSTALVSIGLPVYNGAPFLEQAIDALLAQSFGDFELTVSDNASTDDTAAIAQAAVARDPRVRYHRHPVNLGLARNYNAVFRMASSKYFKWATADDICERRYLEECVEVLEADPSVVLAYGRALFVDAEGQQLRIADPGFDLRSSDPGTRLGLVIEADHWVNATQGVIRTEALGQTPLHPNYPGGDYVLLGELSLRGRIVEISPPLLRRRLHPKASSQILGDKRRIQSYVVGSSSSGGAPAWRRLGGHLRTTLVGPLGLWARLTVLGVLLRRAMRHHRRLFTELIDLANERLGR